jgi:hypothetical protein
MVMAVALDFENFPLPMRLRKRREAITETKPGLLSKAEATGAVRLGVAGRILPFLFYQKLKRRLHSEGHLKKRISI